MEEDLFLFQSFRKWWDKWEMHVTGMIGVASAIAYFGGQASTDYNDSTAVRTLKYWIYAITYTLLLFELINWTRAAIPFDQNHTFAVVKRIPIVSACLASLGTAVWVKSTYGTSHQILSFTIFAVFLTMCTCSISLRLLSQIEQWLQTNNRNFHINPIFILGVDGAEEPLLAAEQGAAIDFEKVVKEQKRDVLMHNVLTKKLCVSVGFLILMTAIFYAYLSVLNQKEYPGATCILCIALCMQLQVMSMMQIAVFNSRWLDLQLRYNRTTKLPVEIFGFALTYSLVLTVVLNGLLNGGLLLWKSLVNYSEL